MRSGSLALLVLAVACQVSVADAGPRDDQSPLLDETEYRLVTPGIQPLKLAHGYCDAASFEVKVEGVAWKQGEDYRVRARSGVVVPLRPWAAVGADRSGGSAGPDPAPHTLVVISYRFLPVSVDPRLDLRPVGQAPAEDDEDRPESDAAPGDGPYFTPEGQVSPWRDGNLQISGSKTVQVSSGNRREMTVDQNLRLNIVGQLTRDISVRAFLSDDNLPVVPEGNTEELRDIDKVLVEMTAPRWKATLGDFVARREGSTFGNYRRKLQGFSLQARPGPGQVEVLAGSPRGLYRTLQIRGQEANQGPYYLGGGSGGDNLFIVAGSERVTLDGELLTRGQDRDYIIDYVRGTVTFTYRRLITSESTIVVEFEEGEGPYGRTVVGAGAGADFTLPGVDLPGRFSARIIKEEDDPSRLRTGELADEDQDILAGAGDDPLQAVASGVTAREPGQGMYDQDVVGGKTIYVYNPAGGDWDLSLFYVGPGQGDYTVDSLTEAGAKVYVHTGDGQGNYLIGRPLPLPSSQSVATLAAALGDTAGDHFRAEWNIGNQDLNLLSDLDADDDKGNAGRLEARVKDRALGAAGRSLGSLSLGAFWERQEAEFRPFQVHRTVFSYDRWGLADRARREGFLTEQNTEAGIDASWRTGQAGRSLEIGGDWGTLSHGPDLQADRLAGKVDWQLAGGRGRHGMQSARAADSVDPLDITHRADRHQISWLLGPVVPTATYNFQQWEDSRIGAGRAAGYRLEELGGQLAAAPGRTLAWRLDFKRGLADSLVTGDWRLQRDSRTYGAGLTTGKFAGMRLVGEGTMRRVLSPDLPEQTTRLGRVNLSGDWRESASTWSLGYRVDNSRTEVLDRQVVYVGESQGDYNQDGDFVGRGQGDYNMVLVGTDSLVATTAVVADVNWRQGFDFLASERWYASWNALTLAAVEGRSTTDDIGGLLRLDPSVLFAEESTVLGDFTFSEELTFLQHIPTVDLRIKFDYRETMDRQYADHPEDRLNRGWQANSNINLSRRSSLRLRWSRLQENRFSTESATSARRSYQSLTRRYEAGWNLRPSSELRLGLQGEYITRDDAASRVSQQEYALNPTLRQRLRRQWTIQGSLRLAEVTSEEPAGSQRPWFYSYPGRNVDSSLRLSWEPSQYLSVSASWFARKQGDRRWQHDVRLESTARF
jgi:hypothetical protein